MHEINLLTELIATLCVPRWRTSTVFSRRESVVTRIDIPGFKYIEHCSTETVSQSCHSVTGRLVYCHNSVNQSKKTYTYKVRSLKENQKHELFGGQI